MENDYLNFFNLLYKDNYKRVYSYVLYRIRNEMDAEDITQEVFTIAYKKNEYLYTHDNIVGWLYVTAKILVKSFYRKNKYTAHQLLFDDLSIEINDSTFDYFLLLSNLSKDQKSFLIEHYIIGYSLSELAKKYNISLSACKMRLKRLRKKLSER